MSVLDSAKRLECVCFSTALISECGRERPQKAAANRRYHTLRDFGAKLCGATQNTAPRTCTTTTVLLPGATQDIS